MRLPLRWANLFMSPSAMRQIYRLAGGSSVTPFMPWQAIADGTEEATLPCFMAAGEPMKFC